MQRIFIVLFNYALVWGIETTPYNAPFYYFLLSISSFVTVLLCSRSNDKVIVAYGLVHLLCVLLYICMIFRTSSVVDGLLYSPSLNYSIIVFNYELYIISTGAISALFIFYNRIVSPGDSGSGNGFRSFEAKQRA